MIEDSVPSESASRHSASNADTTQAGRRRRRLLASGSTNSEPKLPAIGEELFGFRLRHELGRGAYAKVYLAHQADLAGRPVVLKVSDLEGDEPQTLAQLQHTHIVPIYSVHENEQQGLRAVCMPYFGGASLSQVLQLLWEETPRPLHGEQLVRALGSVPNPSVAAVAPSALMAQETSATGEDTKPEEGITSEAPSLTTLRGLSYIRSAGWIVARLAEALQHAHQRGVIHRDIKPSNILLSADGQPMLLDFNVAQTMRNGRTKTVLGGTVAYMSPEHLRALASSSEAQASQVDHRADIYSLGMVLYELLAGTRPFTETGNYSPVLPVLVSMAMERSQSSPSLRTHRNDVPWGLESIARKCLAPNPNDRYQQAEHLAEDLRRFLDDRPLKYAPELSVVERVQKWFRRHPRLASSGSVATAAVVLLVGLGAALVGVRDHLEQTQAALAVADAQDSRREFETGTIRALCLINTTTDVQDHLRQGIEICEQTLAIYNILEENDWQRNAHLQRLDPEMQHRLAEDARELLLLLAWARVHTAPKDTNALERALSLLDRAEAITGLSPCRALFEARANYLDRLGRPKAAGTARKKGQTIPPTSARDHYLLATTCAREGRYDEAIEQLNEALRLNPRHYWALVQLGICHQEQGKYALAAGDFGACIGLSPDFALGYFNRGYALEKSGNKVEAISDYTAAIDRDPSFVLSYLNRGMLRLELKQYQEALGDLQQAASLGRDDANLYLGLGLALEGLKRTKEADAAFQVAFVRGEKASKEVRARLGWIYGMAVVKRLPEKAREAFDKVLQIYPAHPQALYGRAMLLVEQGRESEAIQAFDRAIDASPTFFQAWRFRAILRARAGQFARAGDEINWCMEREPTNGAAYYAAACVASLALGKTTNPQEAKPIAEQALRFLAKALSLGYGHEQAATDPDLRALRASPGFEKVLKQGKK
jgi:serine/threonine protein kinase/Flp pilus assembly protein TadD